MRLGEALAGAVELQCQLAASPHVLQLSGGLQETANAFFVEHEPGEPLSVADLFNPDADLGDERQILRLAIALADALRAAHERTGGRRGVHGGFCAGTVIETADGVFKVADFGIAPAICSVLGAPSYTELAVAPNIDGPEDLRGTGAWEVLSSEEETRDDRLCGFIAPEKYASQAFDSFEPGSDVIAAGILLHLVAEHQHPLIGGEGEHRTVDMAAQMGFWLYNGARRKDLRESENPAVKVWCDLVARMLANSPQQRPTAAQIVVAFAEVDVKPVDATEMLSRAVESAAVAAKEGRWDEVRDTISGIADGEGVPEDLAAKASELLRAAECHQQLEAAENQLLGDDWRGVGTLLTELESSTESPGITSAVEALRGRFRRSAEAFETLSHIEQTFIEATESDPESASAVIERLLEEVEAASGDGDLVPSVQALHDGVRDRLLKKREALGTKLDALSADHEQVNAWFKQASAAWKEERWSDLETVLDDRPTTPHWPKAVRLETELLEKRYADVQAARDWLKQSAAPLETEDLDSLERLLAERPEMAECPAQLRAEVDDVDRRIASVKSKAAELARAVAWIEGVERAVGAKEWSEASRLLVGKPELEHWPTDVPEREKPLREQVEKHLEAVERERLAIEAWLSSAAESAATKDWSGALERLDNPPIEANRLPKPTRKAVVGLRKEYEQQLQQQRLEELRARDEALRAQVEALVGEVVRADLQGLLDPKSVQTRIDALEWSSDVSPTDGTGQLIVAVGAGDDVPSENGIRRDLQVAVEGNVPRIVAQDEVKSALAERFLDLVKERQRTDVAASLRAGFFPDVKADMKIGEPAARVAASIALLGPSAKQAKIDVELIWDPVELNWRFPDPADFSRRAVDVAIDGTRSLIKPAILDRSDLLRRYESVLVLDVSAPTLPPDDLFPDSLTLGCRLTIHPRGKAESGVLQQVSVLLPQAGRVVIDADLAPADGALTKILVDTQEAGRAGLAQSLTARTKQAATRIKLVSLTKPIKRPVDEIRFELRVKRSEPLVVSAPWDVESFGFAVLDSAETALEELLERQPEAAPPMFGKRAAILGGVAVTGAVAVAGVVYWPESAVVPAPVPILNDNISSIANNSGNASSVNNIDNADSVNHGNLGNEGATPGPSVAAARDELSAVLEQSRYLDRALISQHQLVQIDEVSATQPAPVKIRIPGVREVALTLAAPTAAADWKPTESDRKQVRDAVVELDKLLGDTLLGESFNAAKAGWIDAAPELSGYLDASQVSVTPARPTWLLDATGDAWDATGVSVQVSLETGQGSQPVGSFTTEMSAKSGEVTWGDGQDESLRQQIVGALATKVVELQQASLQERRVALQNDASVNPEGRTLSDMSMTTDWPAKSVQLSLTPSAWMRQRDLTLNWDPSTLAFQFDSPSDALLKRLATVLPVLQEIRDTVARRDSGHWLDTVSKGDGEVTELQAPVNGVWKLEVTSAWDDGVRLPVEVAIDLSGDVAQAVASVQGTPEPWYTPLVKRFATLASGTARAALSPTETESLKAALAGSAMRELPDFLDAIPTDPAEALFAPQYVIKTSDSPVLSNIAWSPQDANSEYLSVPASLVIATNRAIVPAGFDPDKLDQTLANAAGAAVPIELRLKVGQAATEIVWGGNDDINDALKEPANLAAGLVNFLPDYEARVAAESSIDAALAGASAQGEIGSDVAYQLLKDIWLAKGIVAGNLRDEDKQPEGDLSFFSSTMRKRWTDPTRSNRRDGYALKKDVDATVFVEYFSGIQSIYAVAWSVGLNQDSVSTGPFLIRLCSNNDLTQASGQANQGLGALLLRPVLELLPDALQSDEDPFLGKLGIVIAIDDLLPARDALLQLSIFGAPMSSLLELDDNPGVTDFGSWNSLAELGSIRGGYKGDCAARHALLSGARADDLRPGSGSSPAVWNAALSSRTD